MQNIILESLRHAQRRSRLGRLLAAHGLFKIPEEARLHENPEFAGC